MEPVAIRERLRRETAELPALGNHVRLIGEAHVEGDACPVDRHSSARVRQHRVKARKPAVQLRSDTDPLAELSREMLASWTGKIKVDRYDMVSPMVQQHGDAALLTFNLVSYRRRADGTEHAIAHWNSAEVYARVDAGWRIIHSHWSFVKPELKQPVSEEA